jgi:hypothetical protein
MATDIHTTFTRRAITRLLTLAPMVSVPLAVAAKPRDLDAEIDELTELLSAKLRERWPGMNVTRGVYDPAIMPYFLNVIRA